MYDVTPRYAGPGNESCDSQPARDCTLTLDVVMEATPPSLSRLFCLAATLAIVPSSLKVSVDEDKLFIALEFEQTMAPAVDLLQRKLGQLTEVLIAITGRQDLPASAAARAAIGGRRAP